MIKTEQQIERDFYSFIKESSLGKAIKGSIYRPDMRPADAKTEDLVVKFYTGIDEQIQSGTVIIDIYIPDVKNTDGRMVRISVESECCRMRFFHSSITTMTPSI